MSTDVIFSIILFSYFVLLFCYNPNRQTALGLIVQTATRLLPKETTSRVLWDLQCLVRAEKHFHSFQNLLLLLLLFLFLFLLLLLSDLCDDIVRMIEMYLIGVLW